MAATVVTSGGGGNVSATTSSTLAVTIASPTSGNLLLVASSAYDNISSISGGGVTTWTKIEFLSGDTNHDDSDIWYGVVDGTPGTAVTITYLSSMGFRAARVLEITGGQKATDATVAFADDAKGTTDSKSITTVTSGCCIISVNGASQSSGTVSATGPTGYTQLGNEVSGPNGLFVAYLNQATAGASTMNWTGMASTTYPSVGAVAIKPSSGGGTTVSVAWSPTGQSAPAFTLLQTDKITVGATGKAAPTFTLLQIDKLTTATTGSSAPSFSAREVNLLAVATTGHSAPSVTVKQTDRIPLSSVGQSNPRFGLTGGLRRADTRLSVAINRLRIH